MPASDLGATLRDVGATTPWSALQRFLRGAGLALAAAAMLLSPASAARQQQQRIVAVGDLHGDYQAWQAIARASGIMDAAGHWSGGKTTLVQLGDIVDRQPNSLQIIRSLRQLAAEAPRAGGKVVVVLGNHEAMNLLGDLRYVTPGEFAAFADERSPARREQAYMANRQSIEAAARVQNPKATPSEIRERWLAQHPLGWVEHKQAWSPSGELGKWATSNPAVVKIDRTLFVHGGISAEYSKLDLGDLNRLVAKAMASADDTMESVLNDPLGPLWYRGLVTRDKDAEAVRAAANPPTLAILPEQEVQQVLEAYGADRIVVGHTPDLKGVELLYGGRLARVDTGISRAYKGSLGWLEILGGKMIPHSVPRPTQ